MKKLRGSFAAKLVAVITLCVLVVICVLAAVGTAYLSDSDAYSMDLKQAEERAIENQAIGWLYDAAQSYKEGNTQPQLTNTNFRYTLLSPEGEELFSTYEGEKTRWEGSQQIQPSFYVEHISVEYPETPVPEVTPTPSPIEAPAEAEMAEPTPQPTLPPTTATRNVLHVFCYDTNEEFDFLSDADLIRWRNANALTAKGYVLAELPVTDEISQAVSRIDRLYGYRVLLPAAAGLSFVLGVLLFLFLLSAAGHRDSGEEITESFVDRIPLDLFTLLIASGICAIFAFGFGFGLPGNIVGYTLGMVLLLGAGLLFLLWCMSFAVRVKKKSLWQNCLLTRLWHFCGRTLRNGGHLLGRGLRALPMLGRGVLFLGAFLLAELLILALFNGEGMVLWILHILVLCPAVLFLIWNMRKLRLGAKEIAGGNLSYTVDTKYLFGELKDHAEDLNHIRDGMNAAVEERMKSEHFKSELITNVSHDIKTPLTSIINYVDLLEKEELDNERAREYVEVLSRQSAKLKKLIDDLIEASKASTGVLAVHPERCELGVLLDQCAGEYAERFGKAGLELVLLKPREPVTILADGRHIWRTFDNLLGNIVKYAQPNTRVYWNLSREGDKAVVIFRNISREQLNLSGEELMERFVRGDSSRNTDGSGLGLAIARSLTQLQGGEMDITVDGDLFKVTLRFACIE